MIDFLITYWWQSLLITFGAVYIIVDIVRYFYYRNKAKQARKELKVIDSKISEVEGKIAGIGKEFAEKMNKMHKEAKDFIDDGKRDK